MSKHLVDMDDELLLQVRAIVGARSIRETVTMAFERIVREQNAEYERSVAALCELSAELGPFDRDDAWR